MKKALSPSTFCKDLFNLMTCKMSQTDFDKKYGEWQKTIDQNNSIIVVGDEVEDDDIIVISVD